MEYRIEEWDYYCMRCGDFLNKELLCSFCDFVDNFKTFMTKIFR